MLGCCLLYTSHIAGRKLAFVPILRAGLGMVDGCVSLVPAARIGHIGLYRDETTHTPVEYYCKLPKDIDQRDVYVVDPMLATGGSAIDAISQIKLRNPRKIVFMCIIAAPEGLEALKKAHPDVDTVSYTHLDVYKRQAYAHSVQKNQESLHCQVQYTQGQKQ